MLNFAQNSGYATKSVWDENVATSDAVTQHGTADAKQKARVDRGSTAILQLEQDDSKKPPTLSPTTQHEQYQDLLKYEKQKALAAPGTCYAKCKKDDEGKEEEVYDGDMATPTISTDLGIASEPRVAPDLFQHPGAIAIPGFRASEIQDHHMESFGSVEKSESSQNSTEDPSNEEVLLNAVFVDEQAPDLPYVEATAVEDEKPGRKRIFIIGILALAVVGIVVGVTVLLTGAGASPTASTTEFPTMAPTSSVTVTVVIQLDDKPEETSWRLTCGSQTIADVPPSTYEDALFFRRITVQRTVGLDAECEFTLGDSGGDGIDDGFFAVYFGEDIADEAAKLVEGSGNFTSDQQVVQFQVVRPPTPSPTISAAPSVSPAPTSSRGAAPITVFIQFDEFPSETGWRLTCDGVIQRDVMPGTYAAKLGNVTETVFVEGGADCLFTITDTIGDGLCCFFGAGGYSIFLGEDTTGILVGEGGDFGSQDSVIFSAVRREPTISPAPTITAQPTGMVPITIVIQLDEYPKETGWSLQCDDVVQANVTSGTYRVALDLISETFVVGLGAECVFDITDTARDGLCCSYGAGSYSIILGEDSTGILLDKGSKFASKDQVVFIALPPEPTVSPAPTGATVSITVVVQLDSYPTGIGWSLECDGVIQKEVLVGTYSVQFELITETFVVEEGAQCLFALNCFDCLP